jgi:hypothetical protein
MDETALVTLIGNTLTQLDTALKSDDLNNQPAKWQQLFALRKHLDDLQRELVQQTIESDDADFKVLANEIQAETKALDQVIQDITKVDSAINLVSEIASNLDQVLQLVG